MASKALLAPRINIQWNPVDDTGTVSMQFMEFLLEEDGTPSNWTDPNKAINFSESIQELLSRTFQTGGIADPVTGEQLPMNLSGASTMWLIKRVTDTIIAEVNHRRASQLLVLEPTITGNNVTIDILNSGYMDGDAFASMSVDWGDGTVDENLSKTTASHTYADAGLKEIVVTVNTQKFTGLTTMTSFGLE